MAYTEEQVIARISQVLQDTVNDIWGTAEISGQITESLRELSSYCPRLTFATVTFASTVNELSISSLSSRLYVETVEYEVGKVPRRFRNFDEYGDTLVVDISFAPSQGGTAYVCYAIPHELSGTVTNTMKPQEERLLIDLVAARLAISKAMNAINKVNVGGERTWVDFQSWGERKLSQVLSDLHKVTTPKMAIDYLKVQ